MGDLNQMLGFHVNGQLIAIHDHTFDSIRVSNVLLLCENRFQPVDHLVEVPTVRTVRARRQGNRLDQTAVTGRVAAPPYSEEPASHPDYLVRFLLTAGHRSSPFISMVGVAANAAASVSRMTSSRFAPRGMCAIFSCSFKIACSNISGRGGQPGR
ncbi:Uncharacterised protein [Mycobacteroides abscessus subsp. abscessus]|nr:Uncharacterised protein [Mycobacteroides abscessus subsp. abscessus]